MNIPMEYDQIEKEVDEIWENVSDQLKNDSKETSFKERLANKELKERIQALYDTRLKYFMKPELTSEETLEMINIYTELMERLIEEMQRRKQQRHSQNIKRIYHFVTERDYRRKQLKS